MSVPMPWPGVVVIRLPPAELWQVVGALWCSAGVVFGLIDHQAAWSGP